MRVTAAGSSPHTRGARRRPVADLPRGRIIPAYAGSTSVSCGLSGRGRDHPRIRGEHESSTSRSRPSPGSSPHTRGAPSISYQKIYHLGIIPAYAGSTTTGRACRLPAGDHPRIRGEHSWRLTNAMIEGGSSPHTRGALILARNAAGRAPDHPRIRGEHASCQSSSRRRGGSSPHTRGARG